MQVVVVVDEVAVMVVVHGVNAVSACEHGKKVVVVVVVAVAVVMVVAKHWDAHASSPGSQTRALHLIAWYGEP
jgi:hypothetical protein